MVSSVTEGHIKKLRKAGYLASDIAHRLPEKGQLIPPLVPHDLSHSPVALPRSSPSSALSPSRARAEPIAADAVYRGHSHPLAPTMHP